MMPALGKRRLVQLAPPSALLKRPAAPAPTYSVCESAGSIAMACVWTFGGMSRTSFVQLLPPLTLLNAPLPPTNEPTYRVSGSAESITNERPAQLVKPAVASNQFAPPSVVLRMPPSLVVR